MIKSPERENRAGLGPTLPQHRAGSFSKREWNREDRPWGCLVSLSLLIGEAGAGGGDWRCALTCTCLASALLPYRSIKIAKLSNGCFYPTLCDIEMKEGEGRKGTKSVLISKRKKKTVPAPPPPGTLDHLGSLFLIRVRMER